LLFFLSFFCFWLFVASAGNNVYIFPGIGLGVLAAGLTRITDHDMLIAARCLASQVTDTQLEVGCVYPPLSIIREVAARIAVAIAENAYEAGKATKPKPADMLTHVKSLMYDPFDDPFQAP
jgi:malate dehydrogenase (oxaloacetate-decarboxylating)(NADP+)